jgi:hypothetical protein
MPFDLVGRKPVAGLCVRQAQIAADDEGSETGAGEVDRLLDAEPADDLHRGDVADPLEDSPRYVDEVAGLVQFRIGASCIELEVHADAVDACFDHASRDVDSLSGGTLVRHEDVGEREPRHLRVGPPVLIAHGRK